MTDVAPQHSLHHMSNQITLTNSYKNVIQFGVPRIRCIEIPSKRTANITNGHLDTSLSVKTRYCS